MLLDFKEIPKANKGSGYQDTFELFCRDFLQDSGYEILQEPDRGADGRKDLIVGETRSGLSGTTNIKWLVSCKHFAHSGVSVTQNDEPDILDRVRAHKCDGFIGFYSTIPSSSLTGKLNGLSEQIKSQIFDREKIEKRLLESVPGNKLARRYFPISYKNFTLENPNPANLFENNTSVNCDNCGSDLLKNGNGIWVVLESSELRKLQPNHIVELYFSCKGHCDIILKSIYRNKGFIECGWDEMSDLKIPTLFLFKINSTIDVLMNGKTFEKRAMDKMKHMLTYCFPYISRDLTIREKERVKNVMSTPNLF